MPPTPAPDSVLEMLTRVLEGVQGLRGRLDLLERDVQHADQGRGRDIADLRALVAKVEATVETLMRHHHENAPVLDFARDIYRRLLGVIAGSIIGAGALQALLPLLLERLFGAQP